MFTLNELRYGKSDPLPQQIPMRAGPLTLLYEDGDLRYIKHGENELVRRIYMAVRDRNWGTILPVLSHVTMDIGQDRFCISYEVENRLDEIHFNWQGLIRGEPDGTITFQMEGQAVTTFMMNRIGLCVLHPAGLAGKPCAITHIDGSRQVAAFPSQITPDQPPLPFTDIRGLAYTVGPAQVEIHFEGDVFEMEDQRNWTDASFKSFCPPLRFSYPVEAPAGTKICQTIAIRTRQNVKEVEASHPMNGILTLDVSSRIVGRLPSLGTGMANHGGNLSPQEILRLKALRLSHLRADVWLSDPLYPEVFERAVYQSQILDVPLCLAMHLTENGAEEMHIFEQLFVKFMPHVSLWLVYPAKEIYRGGSPMAQVIAWIKNSKITGLSQFPSILASGTDADFIFLQRNLPPFDQLDAVCFAINPQVHTFDNASVMETLEAQAMVLASARKLSGGQPVLVSPVTLRPRHNPYATGAIATTPPGELPAQVDYRQPSLFAAAWLVGSLWAMASGGASAVTYFETTGWRGFIETEAGSPLPEKFHSLPGAVFPIYHILADVADYTTSEHFVGAEVLAVTSTDTLKIQGLALRTKNQLRLLVANLSPETQAVTVSGLPVQVHFRNLDETNVEAAMRSPDAYRSRPMSARDISDGKMNLELLPYAVVKIDSV